MVSHQYSGGRFSEEIAKTWQEYRWLKSWGDVPVSEAVRPKYSLLCRAAWIKSPKG